MKPDLARTTPAAHSLADIKDPAHALESMTLEVHRLIAQEKGDTPEADTLREKMYDVWLSLSPGHQALLDNLSGDLYMLQGEESLEQSEDAKQTLHDLGAAGTAKNWVLALELLRYRLPIDEHQIAYFRGRCYGELGYHQAALAFFKHAEKLCSTNENYRYLTLDALLRLHRIDEALERANAILRETSPPTSLLFKAANVLFRAASDFDESVAKTVYQRVLIVLARAFQEDNQLPPQKRIKSLIAGGYVVAGFCHEYLGDDNLAAQAYTQAIQIDPDNDAAITARGLLLYGSDRARALLDFERAASARTVLVWPYFFLAIEALENGEYSRCLEMADHSVKRTTDPSLLANLYEWMGIAAARRGESIEMAVQYLKKAYSLDPFNERVEGNLQLLLADAPNTAAFRLANDISPLQASERLREGLRPAA